MSQSSLKSGSAVQPATVPGSTANLSQSTPAPRFHHPRGLYTLFFTEMWERLSYYGMRALLVLFMVDSVKHGGLGLTDTKATAIYGLYTAAVYFMAMPGGWIGDRLIGAQKAIWIGGIIIACGHLTLAIPLAQSFYLGLILVVLGSGLLKPNVSVVVGELYPEGGARRDAGFTIFYMGVNLGAALGPIVCSALGEKINWHFGFGAAAVGMLLGLTQFRLTARHLGNAGARPAREGPLSRTERLMLMAVLGAVVLIAVLTAAGVVHLEPLKLAAGTAQFLVLAAILYFSCVFLFVGLGTAEKKHVLVILLLFVASVLFWAGFEQAGSGFTLFANRYTVRQFWGQTIPAGSFLALGAIFVILLAPFMAAVWLKTAQRGRELSVPTKFALGLAFLGLGFLVMAAAGRVVSAGHKAWPTWLITTYLLHSIGELCLSPVGLSSVTKLAPTRLRGQLMGTWFLATSLGNLLAGILASRFSAGTIEQMPAHYLQLALVLFAGAGLLLIAIRPIKRLMAN